MIRLTRACAITAIVCASWVADLAHACPACASPLEENRQAFVDTTIFMTLVPLAMMGGFVWWVRRRFQAMERLADIEVPADLLRDSGPFSKRG